MILQFGKYAGKEIKDLPTTYITHVLENFPTSDDLKSELINELDKRIPSIKEFWYGQLDNSF